MLAGSWQVPTLDTQEHLLILLTGGPHQVVLQQLLQLAGKTPLVVPQQPLQHPLQHPLLVPYHEQGSGQEDAGVLLQV